MNIKLHKHNEHQVRFFSRSKQGLHGEQLVVGITICYLFVAHSFGRNILRHID